MLFHINTEELEHILSSVVPIADMGSTLNSRAYILKRSTMVQYALVQLI